MKSRILPSLLGAVGSAVLIAATLTSVSPVAAETLPKVERLQGVDRYDQAVQVSKVYPSNTDIVYLASGERFPDALSAGAVAGLHNSALLLTTGAALPAVTLTELKRLAPKNIVVVGGTAAISNGVVAELEAELPGSPVTRIGGADRFEVSRALIVNPRFGVPKSSSIYLASGANFPDALASSPAAVTAKAPVLLVNGSETVPTAPELALLDSLGVTKVRISGGSASVSADLETSLRLHRAVSRDTGADRFETAVAVNHAAFPASDVVVLASGLNFPDALSVAPPAGASAHPVYLVHKDCIPAVVKAELIRLKPDEVLIVGGPNAVSAAVESLTVC